MIAERALQVAAPGALLVARPQSPVVHVYEGVLTRAGAVPPQRRPVCRVRAGRMKPTHTERRSSLDPSSRRLCARCSFCLLRRVARNRQNEPTCTTRDDYRRRYADLTIRDLWAQALMAETVDEIAAVGHASILVLTHRECQKTFPFLDPASTDTRLLRIHQQLGGHGARNLTQLIGRRREELAGYPHAGPGERLNAALAEAAEQTRQERRELRQQRIAQVTPSRTPDTH